MNAVEHFAHYLTTVSGKHLLALTTLTVDGPAPFLAMLTTAHLRELVQAELRSRIVAT